MSKSSTGLLKTIIIFVILLIFAGGSAFALSFLQKDAVDTEDITPYVGIYSQVRNGELNTTSVLILNEDSTWIDDTGLRGNFKILDGNIQLQATFLGVSITIAKGTIEDGFFVFNNFFGTYINNEYLPQLEYKIMDVSVTNSEGESVTSYGISVDKIQGTQRKIIFPAIIDGREILMISSNVFENPSLVESIEFLGDSKLMLVHDYAFEGCTNLKRVVLPNSLVQIGNYAFRYSGIEQIELPDELASIGTLAFAQCKSLTSVKASEDSKLLTIGASAFEGSGLVDFDVPVVLKSVGSNAFRDCNDLKELTILADYYYTEAINAKFLTNLVIQGANISASSYTFTIANLGDMPFLEYFAINEYSTRSTNYISIGGYNYLQTVVLPQGLEELDSNSIFDLPRLTSLSIPDSITNIYNYAITNCPNLETLKLPSELKNIATDFITNCPKLQAFEMDDDAQFFTVKEGVFFDADMQNLLKFPFAKSGTYTLPDSVEWIQTRAFKDTWRVSDVIFHASKDIAIESGAFENCISIQTLYVPENVSLRYNNIFYGWSSTQRVIVADSVTSDLLGNTNANVRQGTRSLVDKNFRIMLEADYAVIVGYVGSSKDIVVPVSVTYDSNTYPITHIADNAFYGKTSINTISLPSVITSIGNRAFTACTQLKSFTVAEGNTIYYSKGGALYEYGNTHDILLYVPNAMQGEFEVDEDVDSIANSAFEGCNLITKITISASLIHIGEYAFADMAALTAFEVDASNTYFCDVDGVLYDKMISVIYRVPSKLDLTTQQNIFELPSTLVAFKAEAFQAIAHAKAFAIEGGNNSSFYATSEGILMTSVSSLLCVPVQYSGVTQFQDIAYVHAFAFAGVSKDVYIEGLSNITLYEYAFRGYLGAQLSIIEAFKNVTNSIKVRAFFGMTGEQVIVLSTTPHRQTPLWAQGCEARFVFEV